MKGNYFQHIIMLVLVNIIIKPIWIFGIDNAVQNRVGEAVYGSYAALFALSLMFQVVLDMGLQTYNSQKVAQNSQRISYLLPNILVGKAGLAFLYFSILVLVAWQMNYEGAAFRLLLLLGLMQVLNSLLLYFRSCVTALQHFQSDIYLSILDKTLMILFGGFLLYSSYFVDFQIEWFVYAQIAAFGISALISLFVVLQAVPLLKFKIKLPYVLPIVRNGLPIALLVFLMSIFMRGDLVLLERLNVSVDPVQAGKYAASFRLLDAANNFTGILLATWLLPLFAKRLKKLGYIQELAATATKILIPISFGLLIFTYFYGEDLMRILYVNYSVGDGHVLFLFMVTFPLYCMTYVYSTLNTANNKIPMLIVFAAIAAIYSVVSNLITVPIYGLQAVAINSIVAHGIFAMCNYFYAKKDFHLSYNTSFLGKLFVFVCIDVLFLYLLNAYLDLHVLWILGINIAALAILFLLLKIINWKELSVLKEG